MSNAVIGALRVNLGLDSAQFATGVKRSQKQADTFGMKVAQSLKKATLAFAAVGAAAAAMSAAAIVPIKRSIDAMDELSKASQKVGSSAQDLAKLRFAADLSGVSSEQLTRGLTRLNVALNDLSTGATSKASTALRGLGISAGTSSLDAVRKLAGQFEKMPDGVRKSALAVEIFGKAGENLIPLLNSGEAGIAKMAAEAERLGLVVDTQTLKAAEAFNDNLTRLGTVVGGVTTQIAAGMVPALAGMTNALVANLNTGNQWQVFGQAIGRGLVNIAEAAFATAETIKALTRSTIALYEAGRAILGGQGFGAAGAIIGKADAENMAGIKRRERIFGDLRKSIANFQPGDGAATSGAGAFAALETGAAAAAKSVAVMRDGVAEMLSSVPQLSEGLARQSAEILGYWSQFRGETTTIKDTLSKLVSVDMESLRQNLPDLNEKMNRAFETASRFGENLASNLSQALVFGQSLGQALVSSIKAAAAELITSGLLDLLLGGRSGGGRSGGLLGSVIGAFAGFANGTPSAPGGMAMVGERGRELVQLPRGAKVWSNRETESMMSGGGAQQRVTVDVQPSPLFVTTVRQATVSAAGDTVAAYARQSRRQGIAGAM